MKAERPDPMLAVVCGAVARANTDAISMLSEHAAALHRGQVPGEDLLRVHSAPFFSFLSFSFLFIMRR